jgi:hypothetical protein
MPQHYQKCPAIEHRTRGDGIGATMPSARPETLLAIGAVNISKQMRLRMLPLVCRRVNVSMVIWWKYVQCWRGFEEAAEHLRLVLAHLTSVGSLPSTVPATAR